MTSSLDREHSKLPPPWDRIFSLGTRAFVWGLLLAVLYIMRPFFLMVFLTFVFAYIQAHGVNGLVHRIPNRTVRTVFVFAVVLAFLGATGYFLAPRVQRQATTFVENLPTYIDDANRELYRFGEANPFIGRMLGVAIESDPPLEQPPPAADQEGTGPGQQGEPAPLIQDLAMDLLGFGGSSDEEPDLTTTIENIGSIGAKVLGIGSAFLLSLLFSFLIVLDLPMLSRSVAGLSRTKIGFIYDEVAGNIYNFGRLLGRAMEAQLMIAVVNTVLTAIGLSILGLPNLVFLSAIVFFCSFVPVAGVFISSLPICLIALQQGGFSLVLVAIGVILIIHTIEAYVLNPQIFGHHLRMNPVLVLIVLVIGGKLFGVWGLILGVPIVNYFFAHAIRRDDVQLRV